MKRLLRIKVEAFELEYPWHQFELDAMKEFMTASGYEDVSDEQAEAEMCKFLVSGNLMDRLHSADSPVSYEIVRREED